MTRRHRTRASVGALLAIAALVLLLLAACPRVEANLVKLMDVGSTKTTLCVTPYGEGTIRLTLKPNDDPDFYQVPHSIVALPAADAVEAEKGVACKGRNQCTYTHGACLLEVSVAEAKGADSQQTTVTVHYACGGTVLSESTLYASELPVAHMRFTFPLARTLYGLAEHAADLPLRQGHNYELWNTDAFEYKTNSTSGLYGSIPFLLAYSGKASTGVLVLNSADATVRLDDEKAGTAPACEWNAEVGPMDIFYMPGPTPAKVQHQHAALTGPSVLPPYFSLGYHQCRWNYLSTKDCLAIDEGFDKHNMPYDVLWLDIEHTDKKKYFTWESYTFPDPKVLTDALASKGRKLVTVKDPHVKREDGYFVHDEAVKGGYYVRNAGGDGEYVGDCWPGKSSWPDFYNERTRDWYSRFFHDDRYKGGSRDIHTWVDMNEPSVFNGPKNTMPKDAVHISDAGKQLQHKYVHNAYSLLSLMSVYKGSLEAGGARAKPERPFILTRSFFPGSQRYAAMWTGDNMANWEHLQNTQPELLSLSVSNYPFCGCDVGGFFRETEEELFVRWVQAGVFYPFLRAHAHLETKRREPWTFSEEAQDHLRNALALRYSLIPYLYTTFYHAHRAGDTVMRPLVYEFPAQEELREVQDTFMLGPALLAAPVVHKGATTKRVVLPQGTVWYRYQTGETAQGTGPAGIEVPVGMESIPLYLRGGYVLPVKLRLRRNTAAARIDPFTLLVALNPQGNSHGDLYLDDGTTFDYETGSYAHRAFSFSHGTLTCRTAEAVAAGVAPPSPSFAVANSVERVVVLGLPGHVSSVVASVTPTAMTAAPGAGDATPGLVRQLEFERVGNSIVVRKPGVNIGDDWTITFRTGEK